ncbi:MAG TPA: prepilin-type N-terminal cleavage/methylation domain-containing protein [Patescibacteria group bacterium]|nr:prepilin-type N-terminal cleavage/methylation domain-containing protein [Patescibacteria group bacterium]
MKNNKKGFTLIELLVVIAIIGLLATLSVVALNNARQKSRDAKRVSDIKQMQTALELYFVDQNAYPYSAAALTLGSADSKVLCATGTAGVGFRADATGCTTTYMGQVPSSPVPPATAVYTYTSLTAGLGATYTITFGLEGPTGGLTCTTYSTTCCSATPNGITCT